MRAVARILALAVAAIVPLAGGLAGCAQRPPVTAAIIPPGELPDLHKAGLAQSWQRQVHLDPGEGIKNIWRVGLSVYVATTEARIVRIDAKTGVLKWSQGLGVENFDMYRPVELKNADGGSPNEVLVVTRGEAFTLNLETGDESHPPVRMGVSVSSDPVVLGNTLVVGGADTLYGVYLDRPDLRRWVVKSRGDLFDSTPAEQDGNVLVASHKGKLWRISGDTGDWDWKDRKTNGDVVAGVLVDTAAVYVPCLDQRVYAFRADSGGEMWETQLTGRLEDTPAAAGAQIVVVSKDNGAYALARSNGEIKWHVADVQRVLASEDQDVWVSDSSGNVKSLSNDDGSVLASAPATGVGMFVRNTTDKNIIMSTRGGLVGMYAREIIKKEE